MDCSAVTETELADSALHPSVAKDVYWHLHFPLQPVAAFDSLFYLHY